MVMLPSNAKFVIFISDFIQLPVLLSNDLYMFIENAIKNKTLSNDYGQQSA